MRFLDSGKRGNPVFVQYASMYFLIQVVNGVGMQRCMMHEKENDENRKSGMLFAWQPGLRVWRVVLVS